MVQALSPESAPLIELGKSLGTLVGSATSSAISVSVQGGESYETAR